MREIQIPCVIKVLLTGKEIKNRERKEEVKKNRKRIHGNKMINVQETVNARPIFIAEYSAVTVIQFQLLGNKNLLRN